MRARALLVLVSTLVLALCGLGQERTVQASDHPRAARVVYVALGDDTAGGDITATGETITYPGLIACHLPRGARFLSVAQGGSDLRLALAAQLPPALAAQPTLVTIWLFFSDLLEGTPPATYGVELDKILSAFAHTHAHVFVGNVFDLRALPPSTAAAFPGGVAQYTAPTRAYNIVIAAVAAKHRATVVDFYAATRLLAPHPDFYDPGTAALNGRSYPVIATVFYRAMHSHGAL